jgi:hypothetical protein
MESTVPFADLLVLIRTTSRYIADDTYGDKRKSVAALARTVLNDECWPCDASVRERLTLRCLRRLLQYEQRTDRYGWPLHCLVYLDRIMQDACPTNERGHSQADYDALVAAKPTDVLGLRRLLEHAVARASTGEARQVALRFAHAYFKSKT